VVIKLFMGSPS